MAVHGAAMSLESEVGVFVAGVLHYFGSTVRLPLIWMMPV